MKILSNIYLNFGDIFGVLVILAAVDDKGKSAEESSFLRVEHLIGGEESAGCGGNPD